MGVKGYTGLLDSLSAYTREEVSTVYCSKFKVGFECFKQYKFDKLRPVIPIQLKRFDYDWEKDRRMMHKDYFEFPDQLNIEPFILGR